jgi:hypothetical protein
LTPRPAVSSSSAPPARRLRAADPWDAILWTRWDPKAIDALAFTLDVLGE